VIGDIRNFSSEFAAFSVEDDELISGLHAEDVASVVRFGAPQRWCRRIPVLRRNIEAMHGADGIDSAYE
jgi:hypothetical protein